LNLGLDVLDGVAGFDLQSDGLPREGLDKDLHSTPQSQDEMESRLFLDVIVGKGATVFELLAGENETLLIRGDAFFVLNFRFNVFDGVAGLDFEGNRLPRESFDEDLHVENLTF